MLLQKVREKETSSSQKGFFVIQLFVCKAGLNNEVQYDDQRKTSHSFLLFARQFRYALVYLFYSDQTLLPLMWLLLYRCIIVPGKKAGG